MVQLGVLNWPFRNSKKDWILVYTLLKLHLIKKVTQPPEISLKISKLTKFDLVLLHSNRPVSCQSSPKFHTNHSNSEIASPKSIQSLIFLIFETLLDGCSLIKQPQTWHIDIFLNDLTRDGCHFLIKLKLRNSLPVSI